MAGLNDTLAGLKQRYRANAKAPRATPQRMTEVLAFGDNPGALRMLVHAPKSAVAGAALVVVLHGCTQTAEGYANGAGWLDLADRAGFVVLAPEQTRQNNPNLCFNWFSPIDVRREGGEAASIRAMIARAVADHQIDPERIYVTGLSAGGAMTSALLAAYPELFAAGAVVAGLPSGAAANVQDAFGAMQGAPLRPAAEWGDLARKASSHQGPWPRIAIWHGDADATVRHANAEALIAQWTDVHGVGLMPTRSDSLSGHPRRVWTDISGAEVVEQVTVYGMGHGTPLAAAGPDGCGQAGPFLLETGLSSTREIARFFGIQIPPATRAEATAKTAEPPTARTPPSPKPAAHHGLDLGALDPGAVITKALRAAGLMK